MIMTSYKIKPFVSSTVNLITIQSIVRNQLLGKLAATKKSTILTTVESSSHIKYRGQLQSLSSNENIKIIPYYYPLVYLHNQETKATLSNLLFPRKCSLLIGDDNPQLISLLDRNRITTLQEICRAFPEKVPLSLRDRNNTKAKQLLENRFKVSVNKQSPIQFEHLLVINPIIKMWDEAFQVILDCQPTPLYVPYIKDQQKVDGLYRLGLEDFLGGLTKIHEMVSKAVKNHPPLNVVRFDQKSQLNWFIRQIANKANNMSIDSYFFSTDPNISNCNGSIIITNKIDDIL